MIKEQYIFTLFGRSHGTISLSLSLALLLTANFQQKPFSKKKQCVSVHLTGTIPTYSRFYCLRPSIKRSCRSVTHRVTRSTPGSHVTYTHVYTAVRRTLVRLLLTDSREATAEGVEKNCREKKKSRRVHTYSLSLRCRKRTRREKAQKEFRFLFARV